MKKVGKRTARAEVVLDEDDTLLLFMLPKPPGFHELSEIKRQLGLTHRSILIHLRRLMSHELILFGRAEGEKYKFKIVALSDRGLKLRNELIKSPDVQLRLKKFGINKYFEDGFKTTKPSKKHGKK